MTLESEASSAARGAAMGRVPAAMLVLILVLAVGLRIFEIGRHSLWTDEYMTLELSTGRGLAESIMPRDQIVQHPPHPTGLRDAPPWWRGWTAMDTDTHPPLHPMLLRFWRATFGEGDVAARSLSAVISVVGVALLFQAVRLLSGTSAALWAALLMAVAPAQIDYGQFARSYAMLVTVVAACCAAAAWVSVRGPTPWRCAVLGLSMLVAMLTHYAAAGPLLGLSAFLLLRGDRRMRVRVPFTIALATVVWALIWGPIALRQRENFAVLLSWTREGAGEHLARTLERFARLPIRLFFEPKDRGESIAMLGAVLYFAPLLVIRRKPAWLMWWLVLIGTALPVLVSDLWRTSNLLVQLRYTIGGSVAVYAMVGATGELLGATAARWKRIVSAAVPATAALACVLTLPDFYARRRPDFRDFGLYLANRVNSDDVIILTTPPGTPSAPDILELAITHYAGGAKCPMAIITRNPDNTMIQQLRARGTRNIWIINGGPELLPGSVQFETNYFHGIARVSGVKLSD